LKQQALQEVYDYGSRTLSDIEFDQGSVGWHSKNFSHYLTPTET